MFLASLVLAGIELFCAVGVYALARSRTVLGIVIAGLAGFASLTIVAASPLLLLLAFVLALIGIVCVGSNARHSVFAVSALTATLVVFAISGGLGVLAWTGLKERYPFESISERLAYESNATQQKNGRAGSPLLASHVFPEATRERLAEAEGNQHWDRRGESLRLLHSSYVEQFINSPGFGFGRMIAPSPFLAEYGARRGEIRVPVDRRPDLDGSADPGQALSADTPAPSTSLAGPLIALHNDARDDFLDPTAFGYFRDRDHVAGFVPHGFLNRVELGTGRSPQRWLTVRVELVSMLKHAQPLVYVSDRLPNMTELREATTRPLDNFEKRALASLAEGEDFVSDAQIGRIRALGSLRALRQCLECHSVGRGTLLGAFSYEFLCDPPSRQPMPAGDGKLL